MYGLTHEGGLLKPTAVSGVPNDAGPARYTPAMPAGAFTWRTAREPRIDGACPRTLEPSHTTPKVLTAEAMRSALLMAVHSLFVVVSRSQWR